MAYPWRASAAPVERMQGSAMVKTRRLSSLPVVARSALLAVGLLMVASVAPTSASDPPIDFSEAPFVVFAPAPPLPDAISDYPLPDGADDYWELWADDAPWRDAAGHIDAFAMHAWMLRYSATDEDLRRLFDWLAEHDILFGLEVEPLTWPGPDVCDHTESFEGPYDLEEARRIRALGGRIDFLALDEPYSHAHAYRGPGACNYSVEQVVDETWDFVQKVRGLHPGVVVGSIEPVVSDPRLTDEDFEIWLDTWAERTGEPFAFLDIDVDWRQEDWPERVLGAEAVADSRGVPFGMLYLGSEFAGENDKWLAQLAEHAVTFEQGHGGTPDLVGFYSWHSQPDRLLPDDDIDAFSGRINQYFAERTAFDEAVVTPKAISGQLLTAAGEPLDGAVVEVTAVPLDGGRFRHKLSGTVPRSARQALVAVRANAEGGTPAPVNVRIADVSYRENGKRTNRVPNPRFARGLEGWGPYGSGDAKVVRDGDGRALRVKAQPSQTILVDGEPFKVTPGADFEFAATIEVPGKSLGSGYVSVIFLGDAEVARENLWFVTRPIELPAVTTDADGRYRISIGKLRSGRYDLTVTHPGDIDHWPALSNVSIRVR